MILKFLDKDFKQLKWGVDVANETSSISITNTVSRGSHIEVTAPLTKNTEIWLNNIRNSFLNDDGNSAIILADTSKIFNYFIVDSAELKEDKKNGKSKVIIKAYSADSFLASRISIKKDYNDSLSNILKDLIRGAGLGGVNDETYPFELGGKEDRYIPFISLDVATSFAGNIEYSSSEGSVSNCVEELVKNYGKRMYSFYDVGQNKLIIKIDDGGDKTKSSTGLKNVIDSQNESIQGLAYKISRNERINVLVVNDGTSNQIFQDDFPLNPPKGINRREDSISKTTSNNIEQDMELEFSNSRDSLEKINISAELDGKFNYGINEDQVFVGDKITISVFDEDNDRIEIDDIISEMVINYDSRNNASLTPTYIPTIGNDDVDEDNNYVSRRQKIDIQSAKDLSQAKWKNN